MLGLYTEFPAFDEITHEHGDGDWADAARHRSNFGALRKHLLAEFDIASQLFLLRFVTVHVVYANIDQDCSLSDPFGLNQLWNSRC